MRSVLFLVLAAIVVSVMPASAAAGVPYLGHTHEPIVVPFGGYSQIEDCIDGCSDGLWLPIGHSQANLSDPAMAPCGGFLLAAYESDLSTDGGLPAVYYAMFVPSVDPVRPGWGVWIGGPTGAYGHVAGLGCNPPAGGWPGMAWVILADGQAVAVPRQFYRVGLPIVNVQ